MSKINIQKTKLKILIRKEVISDLNWVIIRGHPVYLFVTATWILDVMCI